MRAPGVRCNGRVAAAGRCQGARIRRPPRSHLPRRRVPEQLGALSRRGNGRAVPDAGTEPQARAATRTAAGTDPAGRLEALLGCVDRLVVPPISPPPRRECYSAADAVSPLLPMVGWARPRAAAEMGLDAHRHPRAAKLIIGRRPRLLETEEVSRSRSVGSARATN
jgi:hypothetical protein